MKDLSTPIQYIKGVGPKRAEVLLALDIKTVSDMLYYLPFRYEDRSAIARVADLKSGDYATVKGEVSAVSLVRTKSGLYIVQLALDDKTGVIYGVWFNQPYLKRFFKAGQTIVMYGKAERSDRLRMNHPHYEILKGGEDDSIHAGRIVPIYHLTKNLSQRYLRTISYRAAGEYAKHAPDMLPTKLRARNRLVDIGFGLKNIHFPASYDNLKRAYRRIVFDEFFILQLAVALKKIRSKDGVKGISHTADKKTLDFIKNLPFGLTEGQKHAIKAIEDDMKAPKPMNRLIQGDVGSGKTLIATYALLLTVENGHQGALMAPTEILAEQHYMTLSAALMPYDVNIILLVQGFNKKTKEQALKDIKEGRADIVIGTHAVIQEGVRFKDLGLVVIDEQHKFGVIQRAKLQKGERAPDTLLMTATPIPRTLALTVYGDLDISVIRELPPGRGEITTYWVSDSHREKIYNFIREEISKERQAYIVCPRLEDAESGKIKSAKFMYEELKDRVFKDLRVELIHGRMEPKEKDAIMNRFKDGGIDILVSTVVIEVGIDMPNASVMAVENAERFGLSQLHQLRGRIGRGPYESYFILVSDAENESSRERLSAITDSKDGFEIAEEDLRLRGPGDIFGTRQHGLPELKFGDIVADMEIMELARKEAFALTEKDPGLENYENKNLKENLYRRFRGRLNFARVG